MVCIYYCDEEIAVFDLSIMGNEHRELFMGVMELAVIYIL